MSGDRSDFLSRRTLNGGHSKECPPPEHACGPDHTQRRVVKCDVGGRGLLHAALAWHGSGARASTENLIKQRGVRCRKVACVIELNQLLCGAETTVQKGSCEFRTPRPPVHRRGVRKIGKGCGPAPMATNGHLPRVETPPKSEQAGSPPLRRGRAGPVR